MLILSQLYMAIVGSSEPIFGAFLVVAYTKSRLKTTWHSLTGSITSVLIALSMVLIKNSVDTNRAVITSLSYVCLIQLNMIDTL